MPDHMFFGSRIIAPVTFEDDRTTIMNRTLARGIDSLRNPGQAWKISFGVEPSEGISPFTTLLQYGNSSFWFTLPQPETPTVEKGSQSALVEVNKPAGSNVVDVTLPANRFIRFSNHNKVYLVVSSSGGSSVIYPTLRSGIADNDIIDYGDNVQIFVRFDEPQQYSFTFNDGVLNDHTRIHLLEDV